MVGRRLTWAFILRTIERVNMIASRYSAESMAKALVERGVHLKGAADYLSDINEYVREMGYDPNKHPNGNCAQCGKAIMCDHNGAIYCSRECRQRAYRVRKATAEGCNSPIPKRRARPSRRALALAEVAADFKARKEALAVANTMYALHLKASGDEKECSATPLEDASITPDDETNVTRARTAGERRVAR
jgi:hypothetical protein